ncbi:hypothetical protein LQF12_14750 [Ruania suaedae]|uniref:hypothetical protein n=1 Tax=Ruania suaedae TaxID=2897774 RepID=UPI001E4D4B32|nr:hypothetical protein [Ruania suaedae]UFU02727.1 hypothetical protein LQF12_14750 [Ruania suaedae]
MITLLKHEFIQTRGLLGVAAGAAALLALLGSLLAATGWPVLGQLGLVMALMAIVALVPLTQILLAVRYWQSSHGRGGYLTQTLPVPGPQIYWAKMLWAWAASLLGALLSIGLALAASPLVAIGTGDQFRILTTLQQGWTLLTDMAPVWGVVAAVATFVAMILIWPAQYFFAATIGSQAPLNRWGAGGPVLVYIAVYLGVQIITFVSFAAVPLAVGAQEGRLAMVPFNLFAEMASGPSPADVMPLGFIPGLLVATLICIMWSVHSWKRRVSLV